MFVCIHQGESSLDTNSRVTSREIGPIWDFMGISFQNPPIVNFSGFRINRIYFWGKQHPNLKSLQISCLQYCII